MKLKKMQRDTVGFQIGQFTPSANPLKIIPNATFGGIPGKPFGDGPDGHSLWPSFTNVPNEFLESYFPLRIDIYETIPDTGGAGKNRGGNGLRIGYLVPPEPLAHRALTLRGPAVDKLSLRDKFALLRAAGYRNLWTPYAELYHHESVSRGKDDTPEKKAIVAIGAERTDQAIALVRDVLIE